MATVATRTGFRARSEAKCGVALSGLLRNWRTSAVAPMTSSRRRYLSPILLIRPRRSLPPLEFWSGVRPSQAANWRPDLNCPGSVTAAAKAVAPIGPIPGMVARSRTGSDAGPTDHRRQRNARPARSCREDAQIAAASAASVLLRLTYGLT